ncbi:eukaryotic translation initiation factor 2C, 2, partial [Gamsiella multidivaricata]
MAALQITGFAKRPGFGILGKPIQVRSNHFEVTQVPDIVIHHYDVTVTPDVPRALNRRIYSEFLNQYRETDLMDVQPVYDGRKNMFASRTLPFGDSRTFDVTLPEDVGSRRQPQIFKIKIRKAAQINLEELHRFLLGKTPVTNNILTSIMALDQVIRHKPSMLYVTVGRAFYTPASRQTLAGPLEAWRGYYQSVRPGLGRMLINVDTSATAFYQSGSLLEIIVKILGLRSPDDLRRTSQPVNWIKVERMIKGLRITVEHRQRSPRSVKILGLTKKSARESTFVMSVEARGCTGAASQVEIDIATYFKQTYNMTLNYPMLPCVTVGKSAMLPLEVCKVVEGQRYVRKLDERQTADMIKFTSQAPHIRANGIKEGIRLLNYDDNEYLQDFGMKVSNEMVSIKARILQAPVIRYHHSSREANVTPREGVWNMKDKKIAKGAVLGSWGVVAFATERDFPRAQIKYFLRELAVTCMDTGMNIVNMDPPISYANPHSNIEGTLKSAWIQAGNAVKSVPQLLVCILPNTGTPLYAEIKRVTDTILGLSSQCLQIKHMREPKKQYCANVCLKMNVKLGGMNAHLAQGIPFIMAKPTIIFGGDVSHPQAGDTVRPSIASLVGSMDSYAARYAATVRVQSARTETIADLADMAVELLKTFYQNCGKKPERILFYRDGVSEGQFADILKTEIAAIRAACSRLDKDYMPTLTFVVVQKRHHTRFFPMQRAEGDRLGNCHPGTIIDTEIVHPFEFDFYLQSHSGLLGTSRPAHYYVLLDDNKFSPDELQDVTYKLCYLFARCTRSVSVVPPAYYAHIVAARARFHAKEDHFLDTASSASSETSVGDTGSYMSIHRHIQK